MGSYPQASRPITLKSFCKVVFSTLFSHKMMSFKTFVICSTIAFAQATKPDVLAKRDSSVEVDPYAAYYEQYSNSSYAGSYRETRLRRNNGKRLWRRRCSGTRNYWCPNGNSCCCWRSFEQQQRQRIKQGPGLNLRCGTRTRKYCIDPYIDGRRGRGKSNRG